MKREPNFSLLWNVTIQPSRELDHCLLMKRKMAVLFSAKPGQAGHNKIPSLPPRHFASEANRVIIWKLGLLYDLGL